MICILGDVGSMVSTTDVFSLSFKRLSLEIYQEFSCCNEQHMLCFTGRLGLGSEDDYAVPQKVLTHCS